MSGEKWAKIPESLITSDLGSKLTKVALLLYIYLDLRQGASGYPVRGFRHVAQKLGVQTRAVSKAAHLLAELGLIHLDLTQPVSTSAVMTVIHNPARGRVNDAITIGPPPVRYRHTSQPYLGPVRGVHPDVQVAHLESATPGADNAPRPRSLRSKWFVGPERDLLRPMLTPESRCIECLGLDKVPPGRKALVAESCDCVF